MKKAIIDENEICKRYRETNDGIAKIAQEMHTNKTRVKEALLKNGIEIKKKGKQPLRDEFMVSDWRIEKYPEKEGVEYVAVDKKTGEEYKDVYNRGGYLTTHIEEHYGVSTPTLYDRRLYYMRTGNYWWEQWFNIVERVPKPTKKCKFCDWETEDVNNMSGAYEVHLRKCHGITKSEYLAQFPEEKSYFALVSPVLNRQMSDNEEDFVVCKVCGKKMSSLNTNHLRKHGLTKYTYFEKYGIQETISKNFHEKCSETAKQINMNSVFHKISKPENEISDFIRNLGFEVEQSTRKILEGKEIDIYVPQLRIGFEYNGLYFHTEDYGKTKFYHQLKTDLAESKGVKLYQIFEDEYIHRKDVVLSKIRHLLKKDDGEKIDARKCSIKEIDREEGVEFLEKYHIQSFGKYDSLYVGAYYKEILVGVMSFTEEFPGVWNLTRFATDFHYQCRGIGGKLFSYFVKTKNFATVKTFADRRWTSTIGENIYDRMGFEKDAMIPPSYTLFANKNNTIIRFHKYNFKKKDLLKVFDLNPDLTLEEMLSKIGYKKIWDCGLIRYVYRNPNATCPANEANDKEANE